MAASQDTKSDSGSVLLLVLLLIALLSAIALNVSMNMRAANTLQANHVDLIRARQLMASGVVLAKIEVINDALPSNDDTRSYVFGESEIKLRFTDEGGKIGLNSASKDLFMTFLSLVDEDGDADFLSSAIIDFRDANVSIADGRLESEVYSGLLAGLTMKDRPFESPNELCQILPYRICGKFIDHVTVWNSQFGFALSLSAHALSANFDVNINHVNEAFAAYQLVSPAQTYLVNITVRTSSKSLLVKNVYVRAN